MTTDHDEQIRRRAHELWKSEGQPHGRDAEHWQRARAEIESEAGASATGPAQTASLQGSTSEPSQDSAAPGRKRKAAAARSGAPGDTSTKGAVRRMRTRLEIGRCAESQAA